MSFKVIEKTVKEITVYLNHEDLNLFYKLLESEDLSEGKLTINLESIYYELESIAKLRDVAFEGYISFKLSRDDITLVVKYYFEQEHDKDIIEFILKLKEFINEN